MKPVILIYADTENLHILKEICAGLEEEGVLFELQKPMAGTDLAQAVFLGTLHSTLGCGIGIVNDTAAFQVSNMEQGRYIFEVTAGLPKDYRRLGINAGRTVKKKAFIM